jgi:hypothetical protein
MDSISVRAGDPFAYAGKQEFRTREERAIRLYELRGSRIEQAGEGIYWVPSWDGEREYVVHYPVDEGEAESCTCADHQYRGVNCMHILCAAIYVARKRARRRKNFIASLMAPSEAEGEE